MERVAATLQRRFTLVELLVVITVDGILVFLLLPTVRLQLPCFNGSERDRFSTMHSTNHFGDRWRALSICHATQCSYGLPNLQEPLVCQNENRLFS
jgi:hypothetical protein